MTNEEAIKILDKEQDTWMDITNVDDAYWTAEMYITAYQMAIEALEKAPQKGEWIESIERPLYGSRIVKYKCSVCEVGEAHDGWANYCSYCGADMRGKYYD